MKPGFVSDSLGSRSFEDVLDQAVALGVSGVEVNTGGWSTAPHFDLVKMRSDQAARQAFVQAFKHHDLEIIALNANGNPLHPNSGPLMGANLDPSHLFCMGWGPAWQSQRI